VRRIEDPDLLTGAARFVDDLPADAALHVAFVRSAVPHGRITGIDAAEARAMPGVVEVLTAEDLDLPDRHDIDEIPEAMARPVLARHLVRFAGEPVAVVVAESRDEALDAAEAVFVELDPMPAVSDVLRAAKAGSPLLFPEHGTNVALRWSGPGEPQVVEREPDVPGPMDGADVVVRARFVNQRVAPVPMETNGIVAVPRGEAGLFAWVPSQSAFTVRKSLAEALGLPEDQVQVASPPGVGGGFGAKFDAYPEQVVVCALALRLGRPVRYLEARSENLVAMTHGRAQVQDIELGATSDGRITRLRVRVTADCGAYPGEGALLPQLTGMMVSGAYAIPDVDFAATCVATNTTPTAAYRGAGRPEASALIERAVDLMAGELRLDPAEIRRRNFVQPEAFPYESPGGQRYDSGGYEAALDRALEAAGYEELRRDQRARRERGDRWQLGVGLASYVEVTAWGPEFGSVEVHADGSATVLTGLGPTGQGHQTALAQLVSGALGLPIESVTVVHSDTRVVPRGEGTGGSRSLQLGGSAVLQASEEVWEKARRIAAHLLEAAPDDIVAFEGGLVGVAGAPDTALSLGDLAAVAADPARLPEGLDPGLAAGTDFRMDGNTFPFGTHVSVVEVDVETGRVRPLRHVAVDDCGLILNPMLVDGQVHGGVGQGMAQALYEEALYDEEGNPLTASLMSYAMPGPPEIPGIETAHTQTPTPLNPLGVKGIGEAATIGSTPAVQNAVIDAVSHLGVRHIDMPCTPERVWRAIRETSPRS
jgi:carbon-monoxide dehydrogenase large subunit